MNSTNDAYRCHLRTHLLAVAPLSGVAQRLRFSMPHALALVLVDLEPARPLLTQCYSGRKGGRSPHDPVAMLRCLLLMLMCGCTDPNDWVARLKGQPELGVLSGFPAGHKPPGVGTFYDFFHRLLDGPYQPLCAHAPRPSQRITGRSFARHLLQEKQAVAAQTQAELALSQQGRVENLVNKALEHRDQGLPNDLQQRLNEILMRCAVVPSAAAGLLGDLRRLVVSGDGTALVSHASGWGHTLCDCREQGISDCSCPRYYSDPEATWGYDSAREEYYFGYRLHVMTTRGTGDDLPLQILQDGAHTPDVVLGVDAITRLSKRLAEADIAAKVYAAVYDKGYDAPAFYTLHQRQDICPVIPLAKEAKTLNCAQGYPRDQEGRPLCAAGLPMRLHQRGDEELLYNCPVKRPGREAGKIVFKTRQEECPRGVLCEPESVMGPLLHIRLTGDPRMNLAIPRESALFTELYKDRTATERYNSTLKSKGAMATGAYRRGHIFLTMAVLHAVEAHADAWVGRTFGDKQPKTVEELLAWLTPTGCVAQQAA